MAFGWGTRRKILYFSVSAIIIGSITAILYLLFFTRTPTCFDGIQDGTETGVDCGGPCSLLCADQAHPPVVSWSRAFSVASSTYTAVAYIQNTNAGAGAKNVHYTFQLFDSSNSLITEQNGVTDLPPIQTIPIVVTGINVGQQTVSRTLFSFSDTPVWNKVPANAVPEFSIDAENLSPDGTRLSATITNDSLTTVAGLTVAAVLFDSQDVAVAASKSIIQSLPGSSSQNVVFTWPTGVPNVSRAEITLLPPF